MPNSAHLKIDTLNPPEKKLILEFIRHTKELSRDRVSDAVLRTLATRATIPAALIENTLEALCDKKLLDRNYGKADDRFYVISKFFYDEVIPYYMDNSPSDENHIPAAGRFVSLNDNQNEVDQTVAALSSLSTAIQTSNELVASVEERLQLSKEIDFLSEIIRQPKIHVSALWGAAKSNSTLKWLAKDVASGMVRQAAANALNHLDGLLHLVLSLL